MDKFKTLLKFIFAALIIAWLFNSGKLDFSLIVQSIQNGYSWLICIMILISQDTLSAFRWRWLLKSKSKKELPHLAIIKMTWIGLFFNSFLPGAVTGDFIKLVYARDLDPDLDKTYLVTSTLLDRILGLTGLLFILGLSSVFYYQEVTSLGHEMTKLIHFNLFLFAGAIAFIIALFAPESIQKIILAIGNKIPLLGERINKTLMQVWIIGKNKGTVIKCLFISIVLQFMNFTAFYIISSPFYDVEIPLSSILTFIPIGFMAVAVPISPAGLGVGHVIFDKLYSFAGVEGGASFFNLYFICLVLVNSLGVLPYLLNGKKHNLSETEQFEEISSL